MFDAAVASNSAAAFSGILAALVLAVIGQVATSSNGGETTAGTSRLGYWFSLTAGITLLVQLFATSYMFVLLSGRPANSNDPATYKPSLQLTAFLFTFSGSMLAVSAAGAIIFLQLVIRESSLQGRRLFSVLAPPIQIALVVDMTFLLFGYSDINAAFYKTQLGWQLWLAYGICISLPSALVFLKAGPEMPDVRMEQTGSTRRWASWAIIYSTLLPILVFLISERVTFSGDVYQGQMVHVAIGLAALWSGLSFAVLIQLSRIRSEGSSMPPGRSEGALAS